MRGEITSGSMSWICRTCLLYSSVTVLNSVRQATTLGNIRLRENTGRLHRWAWGFFFFPNSGTGWNQRPPFFGPWSFTLYRRLQSQRQVFVKPVDGAVPLHPLAIWENKINTTCTHPKPRDPDKKKCLLSRACSLAGFEYLQSGWIISKRVGRSGEGFLLPGENRDMACIKTYSSSRRATLCSEWWNLSMGSSSSGLKPAATHKTNTRQRRRIASAGESEQKLFSVSILLLVKQLHGPLKGHH